MDHKKKSTNNTNVTYTMRILAGAYLLYIDYSLLKSWQQLDHKILFAVFMIVFAAVGLLLIAYSLIAILKNNKNHNQDSVEQVEVGEGKEQFKENVLTEHQQEKKQLTENQQEEKVLDKADQNDSKDIS